MRIAVAAAEDASFLPGGRVSSSGRPMDILAPTAWHAACCLFAAAMGSRSAGRPFSDDSLFETFHGERAAFRGQARAWTVQPTAWRSPFPTSRGLKAIERYLNAITTDEDAVEFELFGRLRSAHDAAALAQHYGMPTNLLDFTFDPLAAVFFALADSNSTGDGVEGPENHAVVYTTPLRTLAQISPVAFSFPPVQAGRVFRQSGFFVDFGQQPSGFDSGAATPDPCADLQAGCHRFFFPRTYPVDPNIPYFDSNYFLNPEDFLEQVVSAARKYAVSTLETDPLAFVDSFVTARPPWFVGKIDGGGFYTDDDFLEIGRVVERYLVFASLIQCTDGPRYDPIVLGLIARGDDRILYAVHELGKMKNSSLEALSHSASEIRRSFERLEEARMRQSQVD